MIKKVIVGTEELNLTTNGETRKCLLIIKPSAATCACRGASHIRHGRRGWGYNYHQFLHNKRM